jgi:hypothetical protein
MEFTAVCAYPGLDSFRFHSPTFYVASWSDLDKVGRSTVTEAWRSISPYPAPEVIEYLPGALVYEGRE